MITKIKKDLNYVLCYTRKPQENLIYSEKLAYSMHIAYSEDGVEFQELNHNSGVLFAKATENDNGSLNAKSLKNPYLFYLADGTFGVIAIRTEAEGENDEQGKGRVLLFTSEDLLQYKEIGLIDLKGDTYVSDIKCHYDEDKKVYVICWSDENGNYYKNFTADILNINSASMPENTEAFIIETVNTEIEGIVPRNVIGVSSEVAHRLICKLIVPTNVEIKVPESVNVASENELKAVKVTAIYSDGTTAMKNVDWNLSEIDWNKPGNYRITGKVHQDHYEFPIATDRADPCIGKWKGKYYFIATNDADGNHSLYMREADNIPDLLKAEEKLIIDSNMYEDIKGLLWAPEFHIVEGDLYIFHGATSGEFFYEESHVMKLKKDGNPMNAADWSRPHRVLKKDGTYLCEAGKNISLDMTNFEIKGEYYVVWSQREFLPEDLGAWLYIAKVDPKEPWKLISDPVVLSKPDYGWANNNVFVDEGPFALIRDEKLFLTFASAMIDATYVVGLLCADKNADLLDPSSWEKGNYPLLTSRSAPGEYGPGHNSYVIDDEGNVWNAYHARPGVDGPRSSGLRRVHFDIDDYPVLDLIEEKDLNPELRNVTMDIIVK
ncbi:GH43 family beta-xylosidase [Clostridium saccharoperbutylacetonicum]|uniref:Alpha-N-arabinofuranosidase n=2 Tax=Clostridium TaxID=1485 RepID=M1ML12_9CLOT|nr:family 43 glycosylhydrolase [Clostridium saccharoperbutylacetonicum]AGF58614.1 alpha-N-arabinofuranosidase [Clostridium saccharoperbutylacetonicum N1-4(HMT)]NRT60607.1 GH43 family beta-xylosidase [Clostridium saccharoperbutylacetonicum]NSB23921.1 GH43 family beta-xylosidase [Clostridium saccharoperbutylacetonicum]NSB43297.1 GH43 family beta-xylosidase [Clostridium saccharoperbutylacetonicum]